MPILKSCCGLFSLKTGAIINGILGILAVFSGLSILFFSNVKVKTIVHDVPPVALKIIFGLNLAMTLAISIMLIIGALKRKSWLLLPWIVLDIIVVICSAVSVVYTCVEIIDTDLGPAIAALVVGLLLVALHFYLWLVVLSYYQHLEEQKRRPPFRELSYY